jgi:hypothetical protein
MLFYRRFEELLDSRGNLEGTDGDRPGTTMDVPASYRGMLAVDRVQRRWPPPSA